MDAKSGNGSSGNFVWGVIAGLAAVLGAGGLYLSGVFSTPPEVDQPQQEQTAEVPVPESQPSEEPAAAEETAQTAEPVQEAAEQEPVAEPTEEVTAEPTPDQAEEAEQTTEPETQVAVDEAEETEPAPLAPPVLDQIFVEKDGNALLSGDAEAGSRMRVMLNGVLLHEFTVGPGGQFAEFVTIPFSDAAQGLVLENSDGERTVQSDDYLIAALPKPAEEQVATAEGPSEEDQPEAVEDAEPTAETEVASVTEPEAQPEVADGTPTDMSDEPLTETSEDTQTAETEPQTADGETETAEATTEAAPDDQQIAVLRSGEEGVELVQPPVASNDEPEQIALDTIGYSDTGDVELTGRAPDGSAVRLYLDNRLVADLAPEEGGNWRGEIEGIDPGVYTLRVDEVNTDGTVLSRVETPFKREPVEVLQAAEAATGGTPQEQPAPIRSVTVQRGDTLWAISRERFGDGVLYVRLFEANRELIRDPDLIYPGQIFTIPE